MVNVCNRSHRTQVSRGWTFGCVRTYLCSMVMLSSVECGMDPSMEIGLPDGVMCIHVRVGIGLRLY